MLRERKEIARQLEDVCDILLEEGTTHITRTDLCSFVGLDNRHWVTDVIFAYMEGRGIIVEHHNGAGRDNVVEIVDSYIPF